MAHQEQFVAIWATAKQRYAEATEEDLDSPAFPHPTTVEELEFSLDAQGTKFGAFREKRGLLFDILKGACKPIELVGNLAAGGAGMVFPPSSLCFGAITYLIGAAKDVSASYDAIMGLMGTLKDFLVRLTVYNREDLPRELQEKLAEILAILLEVFGRSAKVIKRSTHGRFMHMGKNILLGKDEKLQGLVGKLESMTRSEARLVGAETLTESKRTGRKVEGISVTVTETAMDVKEGNSKLGEVTVGVHQMTVNQEDFRAEMRQQIGTVMDAVIEAQTEVKEGLANKHADRAKAVLKPSVSPVDNFTKIDKSRVPGTGDWIRKEQLFQAWVGAQETPVLWVSGNPGSGKSYLSGNMISFLQQQHPQGVSHPSHVSVGYFFFKDNSPNTRSFGQALNDLAYQITLNDPIYAKYIDSTCSSDADINSIQSKWRKLFVDYFVMNEKVDSSVYLVIDGVDEAYDEERRLFLELLADLKDAISETSQGSRIHLVMVGRPQIADEIEEAMEDGLPTIHVDWRKNSKDIVEYVTASIKKSKVLRGAKKALQEEIVETISKNANGMFIWVDLMMRELGKKSRESAIRESLSRAPKGLEKMLRHVLEGFSSTLQEEDPADLNTMLLWVTCAARPLSLGELDTLLKLSSEEGDGVLFLEGKLRKQFASFFSLSRDDGLTTADLQESKVYDDLDPVEVDDDHNEGLEDVENETDFESNPITTTVAFCHASIGDFLRDEKEGKTKAGPENPEIGVNFVEARAHVLKTCLALMCDPKLSEKIVGSPSMRQYAKQNWFSHLKAGLDCLPKIEASSRQEIGRLLVNMLRDEGAVGEYWSGTFNSSFYSMENLKLLRAFLEDKVVMEGLPPDDREWVESSRANLAETYSPAIKVVARKWLNDCGQWLPRSCMASIDKLIRLAHGDDAVNNDVPTVEAIQAAAEWAGLEKDALWTRRLGCCFRDCDYLDQAMECFKEALKMEPKMFLAREGIAFIHSKREEYAEAIELLKVSELTLETLLAAPHSVVLEANDPERCVQGNLGLTCERIAEWSLEIDETKQALDYYKKAYKSNPINYDLILTPILMLADGDLSDLYTEDVAAAEMFNIMRGMESTVGASDRTRLTELIWDNAWFDLDFYESVSAAAEKYGEMDYLIEAYRGAISSARKELKPVLATQLEVCLGDLYKRNGEDEKAVRLWDRIVDLATKPGAMENNDINTCKDEVALNYGQYCLQKAREASASADPAAAEVYVQKLRKLCKEKAKGTEDAGEMTMSAYAAMFLALWHKHKGETEEVTECVRPFIRESLMMLNDDDPDNDQEAYNNLAHSLLVAGEEESAVGLLRLLRPLVEVEGDGDSDSDSDEGEGEDGSQADGDEDEDGKDDSDASADASADDTPDASTADESEPKTAIQAARKDFPEEFFSYPWCCDGPCGEMQPLFVEASVCQLCLADLCDACLEKVKGGKLTKKVCDPGHEWLRVAPLEEGGEGDGMVAQGAEGPVGVEGLILVGGKVVGMEEFMGGLREKWGV